MRPLRLARVQGQVIRAQPSRMTSASTSGGEQALDRQGEAPVVRQREPAAAERPQRSHRGHPGHVAQLQGQRTPEPPLPGEQGVRLRADHHVHDRQRVRPAEAARLAAELRTRLRARPLGASEEHEPGAADREQAERRPVRGPVRGEAAVDGQRHAAMLTAPAAARRRCGAGLRAGTRSGRGRRSACRAVGARSPWGAAAREAPGPAARRCGRGCSTAGERSC